MKDTFCPHCGKQVKVKTVSIGFKLTPNDVVNIKSLLRRGHTGKSIADRYGVSPVTISEIKSGNKWKSIRG